MKKAFITGITGQDGSYLAELLLDKGYEVHGTLRRSSSFSTPRINHIFDRLHLHYADISDGMRCQDLVLTICPDEIYNLAAQSHVRASFDQPVNTVDVTGVGTLRLLEAARKLHNNVRFYQASSSEMFGNAAAPQSEMTPFSPRSPYGCAKVFAHHQTINYREAYGIYGCNGILFNHESPVRGETFVTRKITRAMSRISLGLQECLYLGNMNALRDWGHAKDYVEMQWLMLQQDEPDDYVIATGEQHSVREFVDVCAAELGIAIKWEGTGVSEKGINIANGKTIVAVDPVYFRPTEVETLLGDPSKAKKNLGWEPATGFNELVREMTRSDLEDAKKDELCQRAGFQVYNYNE